MADITGIFFLIEIFLKLGFTPCKAEQPLQGTELQGKETQTVDIDILVTSMIL